MEFVHNISRIPWSVLNLWEVTDTKGCRVVSPISAISSSACGQPPLSNAEIEQVTYTRRFCSHANLFTPLLSTAFINLSVGSCETKRTCLLKELNNSWTQIWLKSSQWNFRYHFKAIENITDLQIKQYVGKGHISDEGISLFYKNKREKLACELSHNTDLFEMTAAKATGKIPFLHELGNQEIAIFMWCSREWKTNC